MVVWVLSVQIADASEIHSIDEESAPGFKGQLTSGTLGCEVKGLSVVRRSNEELVSFLEQGELECVSVCETIVADILVEGSEDGQDCQLASEIKRYFQLMDSLVSEISVSQVLGLHVHHSDDVHEVSMCKHSGVRLLLWEQSLKVCLFLFGKIAAESLILTVGHSLIVKVEIK